MLRAPQIIGTPTSFSGTDLFTSTTAGNPLNARVAPTGGTWATSGDATDYAFSDDLSAESVKRSAVSGTNGRYGILGSTNYAGVLVESNVLITAGDTTHSAEAGVIARWTDSSNHLRVVIFRDDLFLLTYMEITEVLAAGQNVIASKSTAMLSSGDFYSNWWKVRLSVTAAGQASAQMINPTTGAVAISTEVSRASLATGATLATGKPGLFDLYSSASPASSRYYDDFRVASLPPLDAVLYPNQSAELRTTGLIREDTGGTSYARVESNIGCLPRLPVSGLENRKVEMYLKGSRGDFDEIADTGIDDISAQVFYRPAWLLTPGS